MLGSRRSPREGNGNPLQFSCLENPMDKGAWQATAHGVTRVGHDLATKPLWHGALPSALLQPRVGVGWGWRKEVRTEGAYVYRWLIHVDVGQKPTQCCKANISNYKFKKFVKDSWMLKANNNNCVMKSIMCWELNYVTTMTQCIVE